MKNTSYRCRLVKYGDKKTRQYRQVEVARVSLGAKYSEHKFTKDIQPLWTSSLYQLLTKNNENVGSLSRKVLQIVTSANDEGLSVRKLLALLDA